MEHADQRGWTLKRWLGCWLVLFSLSLWFFAQTAPQEVVAAAIFAAIGALALRGLSSQVDLDFAPKLAWLGLLVRRVLPKVPRDLGLLTIALWKSLVHRQGPAGNFEKYAFSSGGPDPRSAARRALVLTAVGLPPNTYAVSAEENYLLVHRLVSQGRDQDLPQDKEWPL